MQAGAETEHRDPGHGVLACSQTKDTRLSLGQAYNNCYNNRGRESARVAASTPAGLVQSLSDVQDVRLLTYSTSSFHLFSVLQFIYSLIAEVEHNATHTGLYNSVLYSIQHPTKPM